jgi:tetratricopeptide (TPR) repeat protein
MITFYLTWIALAAGAAAAAAALYGHYRVLPAWLTGPEVCLMEDGGCAVLFRSPRSRLIGVPNALLGVVLYALLAIGLLAGWPASLLFVMTLPAVAMSVVLGYSLITRGLQCRICWTGHAANAVLAATLGLSAFHLKVEAFHLKVEATWLGGLEATWLGGLEATWLSGLEATWMARLDAAPHVESRGFRLPSPERATASRRQAEDPDALYKQRENIPTAERAEKIWAERLAKDAKDFESAWKLARARYWLGTHAPEKARKGYLESGIAAGRAALALAPTNPDGHFWVAANMGALAESFGLRQGLKYRGDIKDALETVLRLDPAYQQGSADRALGRWYFKVPGMFGGSDRKSEEHLRKSLTYNPNSASSLFFLAETLIDRDKKDEARALLQKLVAAPVDPDWAPEDRDFKAKASALLASMR